MIECRLHPLPLCSWSASTIAPLPRHLFLVPRMSTHGSGCQNAVFKTAGSSTSVGPRKGAVLQQRRWQTAILGGTQHHSANSDRRFRTGGSDLLTARFRVRVPVPEPHFEFKIGPLGQRELALPTSLRRSYGS